MPQRISHRVLHAAGDAHSSGAPDLTSSLLVPQRGHRKTATAVCLPNTTNIIRLVYIYCIIMFRGVEINYSFIHSFIHSQIFGWPWTRCCVCVEIIV